MNPVDKFLAWVLAIIVLVLAAALQPGPDDTQAAQDVADEVSAAQRSAFQLLADMEECRDRLGPDAQMFLLDGQHLVCRAAAVKTVEVKP